MFISVDVYLDSRRYFCIETVVILGRDEGRELTGEQNSRDMAFRISSYPQVQVLMKKYAVSGNNFMRSMSPDVARACA